MQRPSVWVVVTFFYVSPVVGCCNAQCDVPAVWVVVTLLSLITFHLSQGSDLGGMKLFHQSLLTTRLPGLRDFYFLGFASSYFYFGGAFLVVRFPSHQVFTGRQIQARGRVVASGDFFPIIFSVSIAENFPGDIF
jgi:hypothetical protein